jgi:hypothetical protein
LSRRQFLLLSDAMQFQELTAKLSSTSDELASTIEKVQRIDKGRGEELRREHIAFLNALIDILDRWIKGI